MATVGGAGLAVVRRRDGVARGFGGGRDGAIVKRTSGQLGFGRI